MNHDYSEVDDIPSNLTAIVFMSVFMFIFIFFMIVMLNNSALRASQENFQRGLTNALKAYTTTYATDTESLKYLSEGYLLSEDMDIYGVGSNPIQINRNIASEYLFKVLSTNVPQSESLLKTCGVYIINIITEFNKSSNSYIPIYKVSIYRNGNIALLVDAEASSLNEVQNLVEQRIGDIRIDIATNYNTSLRDAQKYKSDESSTGDNQTTYSTYSTTMAIVKNVPMSSLFGFIKKDVKEIQTYSIQRGA